MKKKLILRMLIASLGIISIAQCFGQQIVGNGAEGKYKGPFERGYQSTQYCGNSPESWVRGSAFLDQQTGLLTITINLETDAVNAGPKGQVLVYIYDSKNELLTKFATDEIGRGGKAPGRYAESTYSSSINLGTEIGRKAYSMKVVANCTGAIDRWFNVSGDTINDVVKIFKF